MNYVNKNLKTAHCTHFSCHGYFNPNSPLESALLLAESKKSEEDKEKGLDDGYLTLAEIFELSLPQCRLVTLSACETGIPDFTSISDEYIGLPSGFLFAGSPSVVSSLWTVNDLSNSFLLVKFYENLKQHSSLQAGDVAVALNQAQTWLRDVTMEELLKWIGNLPLNPAKKFMIQAQVSRPPDNYFQNPYHWAAFCAIGQ